MNLVAFKAWLVDHRRGADAVLLAFVFVWGYGWGRSRPAAPRVEYRDRVEVKTVTVERAQQKTATVEAKAEQRERVTHRTETIHADGTRVITFDTASQVAARVDVRQLQALTLASSSSSSSTRTVQLEQVPSSPPGWRVGALAGLSTRGPVYGGEVSRRIVGPIWLGAWALTSPAVGVSLGVEW